MELAAPAGAQTLRWSAAGDAVSFDPNAQVDSFTQNILLMVYDTLVDWDYATLKPIPGMAEWSTPDAGSEIVRVQHGVSHRF